jgi:lysozyme
MDRSKLKQELIRDEGIRLCAYQDSVGLWTIGVGHLLGTEKRMLRITPSEAEALLDMDIDAAIARVVRLGVTPLSPSTADPRYRVLVNMSFNLGDRLNGFRKFLAAFRDANWAEAAEEMMSSKWAAQVGPRAERLRDMVLNG